MKRSLAITFLVLLISLVRPAPASAGLWAWLEEWSGPGPFKGYTFLFTACVQDKFFKASPVAVNDKFHTEQREKAQALRAALVRSMGTGTRAPSEEVLFRRLLANPDPLALAVRMTLNSSLTRNRSTAGTPPTSSAQKPGEGNDVQEALGAFLGNTQDPQTRANALSALSSAVYTSNLSEVEYGPGHADPRLWCGYVDQGFFNAPANSERGFPKIDAHLTDIGPSVRLHDGVDLGVGFGWVGFDGDRVTASTHMTVTPLRLVARPVLMAVPEEYRKRWMGLLSVYWKETYVIGKFNAKDFGSDTDPFKVDGDLLRSFGLNFDITSILPAKWGFQ